MKRNSDSLYWQNIQLYSFGVCFNALGLTLGDLQHGEKQAVVEIDMIC
jgi:UDP-sugar transporter A1/2/3